MTEVVVNIILYIGEQLKNTKIKRIDFNSVIDTTIGNVSRDLLNKKICVNIFVDRLPKRSSILLYTLADIFPQYTFCFKKEEK